PVCFFSGRCVTRKLRYFFLLESVISDLPLGVEWRDRMGLHGDEAEQLDKGPIDELGRRSKGPCCVSDSIKVETVRTRRHPPGGVLQASPIPRIAVVCRATINSSSVGTTQASTEDASALMRPTPRELRASSSSSPSQPQPRAISQRVPASFAPIPPVK